MTAGAGREDRLEKSAAEQPDDDDVETESFFPEERVHTNDSSAAVVMKARYGQEYRQQPRPVQHEYTTTERTRFQRISVATYSSSSSSHESTSPKSVLFRTRV